MKAKPDVEIENNLAQLRQQRGFSAAELAKLVGVSRQTIYAMEAGGYVPNTVVALRMARALEVEVEALFRLRGEEIAPALRDEHAALLPGSEIPQPGQAVQLCRVDRRLMASIPSPLPWYFPASDAVVAHRPANRRTTEVQVFHTESDFRNRILVAGGLRWHRSR